MTVFTGNPGSDGFGGTSGDDVFDFRTGGNDTGDGLEGNDIFLFGATFDEFDNAYGGDDTDTLILRGDYSGGVTMTATSILNVERIKLAAGHDYALTSDDANVAAGATLTVLAGQLGAGDDVTFDGSAETDGRFIFNMGAGDDTLTGGAKRNIYHLEKGGSDTVHGGGNIDKFYLGGSLDASDSIDGGNGHRDQAYLNGDYAGAHALVLGPTTMLNVEALFLSAGHSYDITLDDATSNWQELEIDATSLIAGDSLTLDASAEDDKIISVYGGAGDDVVTAGDGGFNLVTGAGSDTFYGAAGNDVVEVLDNLDAGDSFDGGGAGIDTIYVSTNYSSGLTITGAMVSNFEYIGCVGADDFELTLTDDVVPSGTLIHIVTGYGGALGQSLTVDGSADTDGHLSLSGGSADNTFIGGAGDDLIDGGAGTNSLKGNGGADWIACSGVVDTVVYTAVSQSIGTSRDEVKSFNFDTDKFDTTVAVSSTGVASGNLSAATFDTDMGVILNDALDATIVTATGGDLSGHKYLVILAHGGNSYIGGQDYVMELTSHTGTADAGDFI